MSESQISRYYIRASRQKGITGHNLLSLFERRIDNVIYRAKLSRSRKEARQWVRHGHFCVNGVAVDVPSIVLGVGDVVSVKAGDQEFFKDRFVVLKEKGLPVWLAFEDAIKSLKVVSEPKREDMDVPVEEQLIIEYYSR